MAEMDTCDRYSGMNERQAVRFPKYVRVKMGTNKGMLMSRTRSATYPRSAAVVGSNLPS